MILFYVGAGVNHFIHPAFYINLMPPWLPLHKEFVFISGICEVLFALLLLFPITRRLGAYCIIALLIAVFPANIQMLLDYYNDNNPMFWLAIIRLPIQFVLIWWAYSFTKLIVTKV